MPTPDRCLGIEYGVGAVVQRNERLVFEVLARLRKGRLAHFALGYIPTQYRGEETVQLELNGAFDHIHQKQHQYAERQRTITRKGGFRGSMSGNERGIVKRLSNRT